MSIRRSLNYSICAALLGVAALATTPAAHASHLTPTVSATVAPIGALFHYNFSVTNNAPLDLAIVNIYTVADPLAVMNPMAPAGFLLEFDPGLGILSFLEDADPATPATFAPGTKISGFSFDSALNLGTPDFDALDVQGNFYSGTTTVTTIPEPGSLSLIGTLLGGFALSQVAGITRRRRRHTAGKIA